MDKVEKFKDLVLETTNLSFSLGMIVLNENCGDENRVMFDKMYEKQSELIKMYEEALNERD